MYAIGAYRAAVEFVETPTFTRLVTAPLSNEEYRALQDGLKRIGFLSGYEVREDTIKPTINHTPSQNRHLVWQIVKSRRARRPKARTILQKTNPGPATDNQTVETLDVKRLLQEDKPWPTTTSNRATDQSSKTN
ncbi:MAG TPA: hypothetical protein PLM32_06605 [Candidatus Competibacter sp.]|nr:hypothetical protein [Candidatus Competibacter sp.]